MGRLFLPLSLSLSASLCISPSLSLSLSPSLSVSHSLSLPLLSCPFLHLYSPKFPPFISLPSYFLFKSLFPPFCSLWINAFHNLFVVSSSLCLFSGCSFGKEREEGKERESVKKWKNDRRRAVTPVTICDCAVALGPFSVTLFLSLSSSSFPFNAVLSSLFSTRPGEHLDNVLSLIRATKDWLPLSLSLFPIFFFVFFFISFTAICTTFFRLLSFLFRISNKTCVSLALPLFSSSPSFSSSLL